MFSVAGAPTSLLEGGAAVASRSCLAGYTGNVMATSSLEEILATADWEGWERELVERFGIHYEDGSLRQAAAAALMLRVWRNSPIEDAHAGNYGRRNGLHDGVMFARNTWVTHRAVQALQQIEESGKGLHPLYELEQHLLSRDFEWPGTRGNLQGFGYGALGALAKHVKRSIDTSAFVWDTVGSFRHYLTFTVLQSSLFLHRDHFGMPLWPATVERTVARLARQDPAFIARVDSTEYLPSFDAYIAEAPELFQTDLPRVRACLLDEPWQLGADHLEWLAWNPIMRDR